MLSADVKTELMERYPLLEDVGGELVLRIQQNTDTKSYTDIIKITASWARNTFFATLPAIKDSKSVYYWVLKDLELPKDKLIKRMDKIYPVMVEIKNRYDTIDRAQEIQMLEELGFTEEYGWMSMNLSDYTLTINLGEVNAQYIRPYVAYIYVPEGRHTMKAAAYIIKLSLQELLDALVEV